MPRAPPKRGSPRTPGKGVSPLPRRSSPGRALLESHDLTDSQCKVAFESLPGGSDVHV